MSTNSYAQDSESVKSSNEIESPDVEVQDQKIKHQPVKKKSKVKKRSKKKTKAKAVKQEPVIAKEEPAKEEPAKEEPAKEELVKEEPVKEEPVKEEPVKEEPVKEEPVKEGVRSKFELQSKKVETKPIEYDSQLDKYISSSLENSPDIKERLANKEESQNLVKQAYLSALPFVVARAGTGTQYKDTKTANSASFGADELSVDLHQNIFGEGKFTDIKINKSVFMSKTQELEQIKNLITLSTIEAYLNIVRYDAIAKIQKESISSHEETLDKTKIRLDAGLMRASDLYLTAARTASAKSNLTLTQSQLERSKHLLHRYSMVDIDNKLADVEIPEALPETFEKAWEEVLIYNPIIKAKYHEIKTSDYARQKELLALYPSVSVDLSAKKTFDVAGIQGIDEDLSAMLNMKYEFNFGGRFYKAAASSSRAKLRRSEYQKSRSDIYNNLQSLYTDYAEINDRVKFLKSNRDYLEDVIEKHQKEFQAGFRALFDLLNTKNEFFNADIQYTNAIYDRKILAYTILANTGKLLIYLNKESDQKI